MKAQGSSDPLGEGRGGGNTKYEKIKDLNAGAFGFVQLCREKDTGEKVAIKFMERGHKITKVCGTRTHVLQYAERQSRPMSNLPTLRLVWNWDTDASDKPKKELAVSCAVCCQGDHES